MPAIRKNLVIEQNATFSKKLVWRDSLRKPIKLTGYTAKLQVRAALGDPAVLLELSTTNGGIVIAPAIGTITLKATPEVTELIEWDSGVYDLLLEAPDGSKTRLMEGKVTVSKGVTE